LRKLSGYDYAWSRHPLVFLVEAADDISYHIVDFEDGHKLGIISYEEIEKLFMNVINKPELKKNIEALSDPVLKVEFMRAKAIGTLIGQVIEAFIENHDKILSGEFNQPLVELIPSREALKIIQERSVADVYTYQRAVEIEAAGFELTEGLLNTFAAAINDCAENEKPSYRSKKMMKLIPAKYHSRAGEGTYIRLLKLLDFISSMTDSYAVALYKKIKGISLPSGNM
jgi:dGTPase